MHSCVQLYAYFGCTWILLLLLLLILQYCIQWLYRYNDQIATVPGTRLQIVLPTGMRFNFA